MNSPRFTHAPARKANHESRLAAERKADADRTAHLSVTARITANADIEYDPSDDARYDAARYDRRGYEVLTLGTPEVTVVVRPQTKAERLDGIEMMNAYDDRLGW